MPQAFRVMLDRARSGLPTTEHNVLSSGLRIAKAKCFRCIVIPFGIARSRGHEAETLTYGYEFKSVNYHYSQTRRGICGR